MRLVLDTDVVVAAMRSPSGASAALPGLLLSSNSAHNAPFRAAFAEELSFSCSRAPAACALKGEEVWLLSVAMALEYEAICMLADPRLAANATSEDVTNLLSTIFEVIVPVEVHYQWRPQLNDAGNEIVLEAAVNGRGDAIVSFNHKDYKDAPGRFGIGLLTPAEVLRQIRR